MQRSATVDGPPRLGIFVLRPGHVAAVWRTAAGPGKLVLQVWPGSLFRGERERAGLGVERSIDPAQPGDPKLAVFADVAGAALLDRRPAILDAYRSLQQQEGKRDLLVLEAVAYLCFLDPSLPDNLGEIVATVGHLERALAG